MLAMSSTSSSSNQPTNPFPATNLGGSPWPLFSAEDPLPTLLPNYHNHHNLLSTHFITPQLANNYSSTPSPPPFLDLPPRSLTGEDQQQEVMKKDSSSSGGTVVTTMKKLNHNASERHRRRKINNLYSSLRSMLPPSDHHHPTKKLSIPTTVSRVLKYIPELQQQVEALSRKKKDLLSTIANNNKQDHVDDQSHIIDDHHHTNSDTTKNSYKRFSSSSSSLASSSSTVSTSWVSEEEVMVQISVAKRNDNGKTFHISEILLHLQETGLVLVNSSSFQSSQGRVFYSLHFKVEGTRGVATFDGKVLSEKLLNLYASKFWVGLLSDEGRISGYS